MYFQTVLLTAVSAAAIVSASQVPLFASHNQHIDSGEEYYTFKWPIHKVAIIGAGPGGLINYREFVRAGYDVHLFERDNGPGGNWHYSDELPDIAPVPNADISVGDYEPSLPPKDVKLPYKEVYHGKSSDELLRRHRAPKPIWNTLRSNAPAPVQQITELPWPKGTSWELPHAKLGQYIRAFASYHGANSNDNNPRVAYNTRVELVEKRYDARGVEAGWTLTLKTVEQTGAHSSKATWRTEDFDAVVVATGRYNAPNIPNIPGLKEWAERFPGHIKHSRAYRRPEPYANKTVLVVGAATSGAEIARDLSPHVTKAYQSIRPDNATKPHFVLDVFLRRLPANVTRVPEITRFLPPGRTIDTSQVELSNGTVITGLDAVIFATGFHYTFPFLPQYHNSSVKHDNDSESEHPRPIVTDGTHLRALYLDVFYIEEPTLGFVNVNVGMQSFTYAEYIGVALTKVWAGKAHIPNTRELWRRQEDRLNGLGGYGKHFQFLGSVKTKQNIRYFVGWLNGAAARYGGRQIDGLSPGNDQISDVWNKARFGNGIFRGFSANLAPTGYDSMNFENRLGGQVVTGSDLVDWYNDAW